MKKSIHILTVYILFNSCASLTESQIKTVQQFAKKSASYSESLSQTMTQLGEIRTKRSIYFANSFHDENLHINLLDSIDKIERQNRALSKKADITFKIISKYAEALTLISSDAFENDLQKHLDDFGMDINDLVSKYNTLENVRQIPTTIDDPINKLLFLGTKRLIRSKQAKLIKEIVPKADRLISEMTNNLLVYLESTTIKELIQNEEKNLKTSYLSFLKRTTSPTVRHDLAYLELKNTIYELKQLNLNSIKSTKSLRKAHEKLVNSIHKKKKLSELYVEFKQFYVSVDALKSSIEKLN